MVVAPFESFERSIPGGSLVDDELPDFVLVLLSVSVCTEEGFAGALASLSTGNSVIVPAAL